jgi:hypothetical protein
VLIGVSAYECAEFPPIRAARNSLQAMQSLLADPALCGWPAERITIIANPSSAAELADRIADLAEATTGVLLLYYVGHGVLSARGELCLTVTSTRPNRPKITGLPWETLAEVLRICPARTRLAILDCCFAGQAIEALGAASSRDLADITHVDGVYTLTATTRNRTAHVPPPGQQDTACTSFTGELLDLIRSGIPGKSPWLTFSDIYPELRQRLQAKGLPAPSQRGTDTAHQFPFTANSANHAGGTARTLKFRGGDSRSETSNDPEPVRDGQLQQSRVLTDTLRGVWSIADVYWKAYALARIADAVAAADPDRAAQLATDAERIAKSNTVRWQESVQCRVVETMAITDPDRAERIARSITSKGWRAHALARIAVAMAATDPERATQLAAEAKRKANWMGRPARKAVRSLVIEAMATIDPDRAERIAGSLTDEYWKASALTSIAGTVAATDPDRAAHLATEAERIARSLTDTERTASALARIAGTVAATDPDRAAHLATEAERIARSLTDTKEKASVLASIAEAVARRVDQRAV